MLALLALLALLAIIMAKIAFNKSMLKKERDKLALYEEVLPSLDLKRMQLTAEFKRARGRLKADEAAAAALAEAVAKQLPMLAYRPISLKRLVRVRHVGIEEENVVGVRLPLLGEVQFDIAPYSMLAKPHWVDVYVDRAREMVRARLAVRVSQERAKILGAAVRRITQRVNLFEKILIPAARTNIMRIRIFLGDAERSAIVRSKIAKAMYQEERRMMIERQRFPEGAPP